MNPNERELWISIAKAIEMRCESSYKCLICHIENEQCYGISLSTLHGNIILNAYGIPQITHRDKILDVDT